MKSKKYCYKNKQKVFRDVDELSEPFRHLCIRKSYFWKFVCERDDESFLLMEFGMEFLDQYYRLYKNLRSPNY